MTKPRMMKAVRIEKYVKNLSEITTSQIPIPTFPPPSSPSPLPSSTSSDQHQQPLLLIRITHTSPTHVDTLYSRGLHQNNHSGLVRPPFTLGLEFVGEVIDIHPPPPSIFSTSTSSPFQKGDKVWGTHPGCFTAYITTPSSTVYLLPSCLSPFHAAGLGASTAPVSYGALVRLAGLKSGEKVLIHGAAGGLGVAAVAIALAVGADVIGTGGSDEKRKVVNEMFKGRTQGERCGVVRYDREGWEEEVIKLSGGKGVDVVFDTVGLVGKSIRCCRFGGRVVIVGFVGLDGVMEKVAMNRVLLKGVKVLGYRFGETMRQDPEENERTWEGFYKLLEGGGLEPVVYKTYTGLEFVRNALLELASRKVYGKIVVEVTDEDAGVDAIRKTGLKL